MSSNRYREFSLKEDDIFEVLMADNSDDEDGLLLDEEDQAFIAQDMDAGMSTVEIEPSSAPLEENYVENQDSSISVPTFNWRKNSYSPRNFSEIPAYNFAEVNILDNTPDMELTPIKIFNALSPIPTTTVKRRVHGSGVKVNITCPEIVVKYNKCMGGVDLMDQKKVCYEVDRKAKIKYYLRLYFDILDIAMSNSYIIYCKLHESKRIEGTLLSSLEFRQVVARSLIGSFSSRQRSLCSTVMTKKRISLTQKRGVPSHVMIKVSNRKRCVQCAKLRIENRTNNTCSTCNVHLCYTSDRNCFAAYH